jgi:hypothetical protein
VLGLEHIVIGPCEFPGFFANDFAHVAGCIDHCAAFCPKHFYHVVSKTIGLLVEEMASFCAVVVVTSNCKMVVDVAKNRFCTYCRPPVPVAETGRFPPIDQDMISMLCTACSAMLSPLSQL